MDRGTRRLFLVSLLAIVVLSGVAIVVLGAPPTDPSEGPPGTTEVVGVVVGVDAEGIGDVRSFRLRGADGTVRTFGLADLENGTAFPPGHIAEHQVTAQPVRVWYRTIDGVDQAIRIVDAEG